MGQHKATRRIVNRLSRIEGHIRGAKAMVERDRSCADVLVQLAAIRAAVEGVAKLVLSDHFESCLAAGTRRGGRSKALSELRDALDRFLS